MKRTPKRSPKRTVRKSTVSKSSRKSRFIKRSPYTKRTPKRTPKRTLKRSPSPSSNYIILKTSSRPEKKFMVIIQDGTSKKTIHFGANGMSDYTKHKDPDRKQRYINRHGNMGENWTKSGIKTAGFWSLHLLWNKPTIKESIKDIERKFNVKIKY